MLWGSLLRLPFLKIPLMRQEALQAKIIAADGDERPSIYWIFVGTWWVYCHEALENFNQLYIAVVELFEDIISQSQTCDWNHDTISDATSLLVAITILDVVCCVLKPLRIRLQSSFTDICKAYNQVSKTKEAIKSIWDDVDNFNSKLFDYIANLKLLVKGPHCQGVVVSREVMIMFLVMTQLSTTEVYCHSVPGLFDNSTWSAI